MNFSDKTVFVILKRWGLLLNNTVRKDFDECSDQCERWLYSIRNMHRLEKHPDGIKGTELEELYKEALFAGWSAEKRSIYEKYNMNRNDYKNILAERYEDGFADGREEAILQTAKKMKMMGLSTEMIIQATGLSEEDCKAL